MKQPITILLLCAGLLLIACESKKEKAFRLLTNDAEAYWELKSVSCKTGKPLPFKHKLVLSFSTDSTGGYFKWRWDKKLYATDDYYDKVKPPYKGEPFFICTSGIKDSPISWKLLNENILLVNSDSAQIRILTEDTLKLDYFSETCNIRTFVRMKNTHLVKR